MKWTVGLLKVLGAVLALLGLGLFGGGAWLALLGGSWFYLVAGALMCAAGVFAFKRSATALILALVLLAFSVIWGISEVGLDFWGLFPRVFVFLLVAFAAALFSPLLVRRKGTPALGKVPGAVLSVVLGLSAVAMFANLFVVHPEVAADDSIAPVIAPDAGHDVSKGNWIAWGRDQMGQRFAPVDQINAGNVNKLETAWVYRTGDLAVDGAEYQVTPLKIDDTLYMCTPLDKVIAIDAITGKQKWRYDPHVAITPSNKAWKRCRGVGYADLTQASAPGQASHAANVLSEGRLPASGTCQARIVTTTIDGRIFEVDAKTGQLCRDFGNQGFVNLLDGLTAAPEKGSYYTTSAPLVANGVIVVGGHINDNMSVNEPSGVVRGYDVRTGKLLWAWDALRGSHSSTPLAPGETYAKETPNLWGTASYDPKLGLAYFPLGNQTPDFWTGNRHAYSNEYTDSLVAVDIKTGKERWHFRTANIDQYDYDVSSQPILYDIPQKDGTTVPAVIQLTKRGQIFVLDRRTGKPVFPVTQVPVAQDGMPGMQIAKTQPFSALHVGTKSLQEKDAWGGTIFDQLMCRIQFRQMRWEGPFTPVSDKKRTLIYPGYYGGFNWGGGALDASTGTLIVNDIRMAQWARFIKQDVAAKTNLKPSAEGEYSTQTGTPWGVERSMWFSPLGLPCIQPPYGSMTAIDLRTGKTKWQVPMGTVEDTVLGGVRVSLPAQIGMPTMGGPLVTGGNLTFFHGTQDFYTRALDSNTGKVLWKSRLPVGGQGAPMTYVGADGRQYIVVVAGGATRTGTNKNRGDYVIAYALPKGTAGTKQN